MLKTIKKSFLAVVLAVATLFALTSCVITGGGQTTTDPTLDAQAALSEFTEQVTFANTAEVTTSFNLPAAGKKGSYQIPITWTSNNEAVIAITDLVEGGTTSATHKKASVTRPAFDAEDVTVTLTAEFSLTYTKNDGTSATLKETKTYNFTVLKETSEIAGGTLADIKANAGKFYFVDNAVKPGSSSAKELAFPVEFDATVTAVLGADGAGQFTVNDGTAGIYVYSNKTTVNIGDKVHIKGDITVYYGTLQVGANIEVTVLGKSDQTIEFKPATPGSINAMNTADGMYGGQALKVSGTLLFGKYNNGSSDSFWLEDAQTGSQIELYYKSFTAAEKEALKAYAGKYVEMDVVTYDTYSSSAPNDHRVFAIPSTVKEAAAPTVSDADKVAAAVAKANAASLKDVYYNGDAFAFPTIDVAEGVNIEWSLEPAALLVDGKLVITAAGTATLKAVITCGELTETVTLTINLDVEVPAVDTGDFKEDTPYYIVATNGKGDLHFDGTLTSGRFNGKYTAAEAVKVYVEKADNGLYIYFLDGTTKTYIVMGDSSSGGAFTTDKASATVFEYNATVDTLVVAEDSNNRAFGVGATSTYDNFSAYDITNTYNWGKFVAADGTTEPEQPEQPTHTHTACPECGKCTAADCDGTDADKCQGHTPVEPEQPTWGVVTEFKENVAYKFGVVQGNLSNKLIYLTGNYKNTYYGESTDDVTKAADIYVVAVEGGYNLKLVKADGTVLYINLVASGTHINIKFEAAASTVWTFDAELDTFIATVNGTKYYVGTYNTYDTISPSSIDKAATSFVGQLYGQTTGGNTPVEPEQPTHEHTLCPECGKCTAEDCDGADTDKCAGHTPVEPEQPEQPVVTGGKADLETLNGGKASSSYANSTSTNGWEVKNSAINGGKSTPTDANPNFTCLGGDEVRAITLNGKVSAPGSITSPVLEGGISKLTFNYTNLFTDKQFKVTITIKNEAGEAVATKVLEWTVSGAAEDKYDNQTFVWELETAVSGKFIIEIVNNCPTQATGNKDRLTIWNIEWVGATDTPAEPEVHKHTEEVLPAQAPSCFATGLTEGKKCSTCGEVLVAQEEVPATGEHVDANLDITCDTEGCTKRILPAGDSKISIFTAKHMVIVSFSTSYYVEGVVTEVKDAYNGIFVITDENGDSLLVRLPKNADGVAYTQWTANKVVLGDTIQLYGQPKKNTETTTMATLPAKMESAVLTVIKHEHAYSDATCKYPATCDCLATNGEPLSHVDADKNELCDLCQFNLNHKVDYIKVATDTTVANGVLAADKSSWTWSSEQIDVIIAKGGSTTSVYTSAKAYMQLKKLNTLTVASKNGEKIANITIYTNSETQFNNLKEALTGVTFTEDAKHLSLTINCGDVESYVITNNGTTTAYVTGVEIDYAPKAEPVEPEFTVTIAEFAEEFLADWNAIASSPAAKASFRADTSATIKEVFVNAEFLAKYSWLFTYLEAELKAEYPDATSEYITDALRDLPLLASGDTAVILVSANTRTLIRLVLEGLMNESLPDTSNYVGSFDKYVVDYSIAENKNAFLTAYTASLEVKPEEPEVPAHTHTACPTCGLCTAEDCDGADTDKCQGHVVEPTYLTVAEVKALTSGATASVKGVVIAKGTESLLIQDETGAIMLYKANSQAAFGETMVGDVVTAEGKYSPYNGLHEVANLTSLTIAETGTAPAVTVLTAIDAATIESLQCKIVSIELTYVSGTIADKSNATFKDANGNNVTVRGDAKWGTVETVNLVPGTTVKVTAFVNWFNGAQLTNVPGHTYVEVLSVPTHEHTACPTCGLCTAEDCDGANEVKCQGHTTEPGGDTEETYVLLTTVGFEGYTSNTSAKATVEENGITFTTNSVNKMYTDNTPGSVSLKFNNSSSSNAGFEATGFAEGVSKITFKAATWNSDVTLTFVGTTASGATITKTVSVANTAKAFAATEFVVEFEEPVVSFTFACSKRGFIDDLSFYYLSK